jgi:hypothetical protein
MSTTKDPLLVMMRDKVGITEEYNSNVFFSENSLSVNLVALTPTLGEYSNNSEGSIFKGVLRFKDRHYDWQGFTPKGITDKWQISFTVNKPQSKDIKEVEEFIGKLLEKFIVTFDVKE